MRLVYVGPILDVIVPLSAIDFIAARRGEPVEVPDALALRLLEQDTWRRAPEPEAAAPAPADEPASPDAAPDAPEQQ